MGIDLSAVSSRTWLGRSIRWPLRFIPSRAVIPILQGALRWKRWTVGSSTHGCWLGSYEHEKCRLFERLVRPGDVVYDLGAHAGFYTLLASTLVGPTGQVVAFEPLPRNLLYLRRHLALNGIRNVVVVDRAVYDRSGVVRLREGSDSHQARLDDRGSLRVQAVTLDEIVFQQGVAAPTLMKIDVEGAEAAVFRGASRLLVEKPPRILLSTHGAEVHAECCRVLTAHGYKVRSIGGSRLEESSEVLAEPS